jgi:hypothetical protein
MRVREVDSPSCYRKAPFFLEPSEAITPFLTTDELAKKSKGGLAKRVQDDTSRFFSCGLMFMPCITCDKVVATTVAFISLLVTHIAVFDRIVLLTIFAGNHIAS